jgi:dihydrofolate reductase
MRKLIVQQWATVDNIVAEEDGGLSFVDVSAQSDKALADYSMDFIDNVDTMILGANTYNMSNGYWPNATDQGEYGEKLNKLDKVVASKTLQEAPWGDFSPATITADPVATIQELKKQDGKDLWVWGSLTLVKSLFEAGEVDEVHMRICPTTRGKGKHLFTDQQDLELIGTQEYDNGVVVARYGVKKK